MIKYEAGLISSLFLSKSPRPILEGDQQILSLTGRVTSNIYLNKDADGSIQPVYINLNGSDCAWTPDDKSTCTFHVR